MFTYPQSFVIIRIIRGCCLLVKFAWNVFRREIKFERPILFDPFLCFLFRVFPLFMLVGVFVNFSFIFICRCVWKSPWFVLSCGVCTIFVRVCGLCVLSRVLYRFLCLLRCFWLPFLLSLFCCHRVSVVLVVTFVLFLLSLGHASHESEGDARLWRVWWVCVWAFSPAASVEFGQSD